MTIWLILLGLILSCILLKIWLHQKKPLQQELTEAGKLREEPLKKPKRNYLELTLSSMQEAVLIANEDQTLTFANAAAERLLAPEASLMGQRLSGLIQGRGRPIDWDKLLEECRCEQHLEHSSLDVHIQGKRHSIEFLGIPLKESNGQPVLLLLCDATELERQKQLHRDFVSHLYHEFNTPLTIIKGLGDLLAQNDSKLPIKLQRRQHLQRIEHHVLRLCELMDTLAELSGLETGRAANNSEKTALQLALPEVLPGLKERLGNQAELLRLDISSSVQEIPVHKGRLKLILENLIDNVARHAEGFTQINLRAWMETDRLYFSVEDDGCG